MPWRERREMKNAFFYDRSRMDDRYVGTGLACKAQENECN
jgi:hypothetical protein